LRWRAGENAQRNDVQRGTGALVGFPWLNSRLFWFTICCLDNFDLLEENA